MKTETYNGWTNYETWLVNLWMDNDQGSQEFWREQAEEFVARNDGDKAEAATDLAEQLKHDHDEAMPEVSGVFADLLNSALSEVDWHEIAEHLVADVEYTPETDSEEDE